jgi:hypothetical protein
MMAQLNNWWERKIMNLSMFFSWTVRFGDLAANILGGYAYVKYLTEDQKMSKDEAMKLFRRQSLTTQQSTQPSLLSDRQNEYKRDARRFFSVFLNTSYQYTRKMMNAIIEYQNGDISKKQAVKTILLYGIFNNIMYTALTGKGLTALFIGDDDEEKKEAWIRLALSPFTPLIDTVGILGFIGNYLLTGAAYQIAGVKMVRRNGVDIPLLGDTAEQIQELFSLVGKAYNGEWEEFTLKDTLEIIGGVLELKFPVNLSSIYNMGTGVLNIFDDDSDEPWLVSTARLAGVYEKSAYVLTTGEAKPKPKKRTNRRDY